MKFKVVVAEITTKTITVIADSQEDALMAAADMYNDGEIDMCKDISYTEAEFRIENWFGEE